MASFRTIPGVVVALAFAVTLGASDLAAQLVPQTSSYRTLKTQHFQVHYPGDQKDFARRAGRIAERIHAELEPKYRSGAEDTHIILVYSTDVVNAFATPVGIDTIVLFLDNPRQGSFSRFDLWAELLIRHEYTHILSLRQWSLQDQPVLTILRFVFGVPPNLLSPFGFIEGVAVFEESKTGTGRIHDPLTEMTVRTAVLEDAYPSLAEILNGSHRWPFGSLGYLYGGRLMQYIADRYGDEAVRRYWHKDHLPFTIDSRLSPVLPVATLYREFRKAEVERYEQELDELRAQGITEFERLTNDGYTKEFLYVNAEGEVAYFASPRDRLPGLYVLEEDGEQDRRRYLSATRGFAEGGERKVYSEDTFFLPGFGLRYELFDGDDWFFLDRLRRGESGQYPSLTSDGRRLFYVGRDNDERYLATAQLDADDDLVGERRILTVPFTGFIQYTALSPDDSRLAVLVREGERGQGALMLCDVNTLPPEGSPADCRVLVGGPGTKIQPRFSPDGAEVIFASDVDGIYNLYSVDVNSGRVQRLTRTLTGLFFPAPSGDSLYALGYFSEGYDVVRLRNADLLREEVSLFDQPVPGVAEDALTYDGLSPVEGEEAWEESGYFPPLEIRPTVLGLFGPISSLNFAVLARDPMFRHLFLAGVGAAVPDPVALAQYDYARFALGLSAFYATNNWKRPRQPGCLNDEDPLRFLCDGRYWFFEEARGYVRYTGRGRYTDGQILLGYAHQKLRNARRIRATEYDARDLNLSGPSALLTLGRTHYFPESVSPELGWRLFASTDYYTKPESTDKPDPNTRHEIEYGVAEGGLALYLPSFFSHHVNYLNGYGYGSYGPDRQLQKVRLNRFVRGQEYDKAPSDHSAFVFTYEYRFPLIWLSQGLFGQSTGFFMFNGVGVSLFYDYGTVFDRKIYSDSPWAGAYGVAFSFSINVLYLRLPELKLSIARGTGPAGETQVYLAFNAEFGTGPIVGHDHANRYDPVTAPYRQGFRDRKENAGYWRDRWAGGVLE